MDGSSPAAPAVSSGAFDLDSDISLFDELLSRIIERLEGEGALELVRRVRVAAQQLRAEPSLPKARDLRDELATLDLPSLRKLTRAFSVYFDLINLAEQRARLRALRRRGQDESTPIPDSLDAAVHQLRASGLGPEKLGQFLSSAFVIPVFTAHPSEARRRTILEKLEGVSRQMDRLEYAHLLPRERRAAVAEMTEEIEAFWLTNLVRQERPTVLDEVRQGLSISDQLFQVIPRFFLVITAVALFGSGIGLLILIIALTSWSGTARLVRAQVMSLVTFDHVTAARAGGARPVRVLRRHILPLAMPPLVAHASFQASGAILVEAGVSFLGLGDPSVMTWGALLHEAHHFLRVAWWLAVFPGLALTMTVLSLHTVADGLSVSN